MEFNAVVDYFMRNTEGKPTDPRLLYRDTDGEWHCEYTHNQDGVLHDWVEDAKAKDPFAITLTNEEYAGGSFPHTYDKLLAARLRAEYNATKDDVYHPEELHALVNFFEENMGELSSEKTDYIAQYDRPLAALYRMIPFELSIACPGEDYDEDTAWQAFDIIEDRLALIILRSKQEEVAAPAKRDFEGYKEKFSMEFAGKEVVIAEKPGAERPYLICYVQYNNDIGLEERSNAAVSEDYLEIMREFVVRMDALVGQLEAQRQFSGLPVQVMTEKDCLPGSRETNWVDKLLIIKPEILCPEYRSSEHQLVLCTGGFGAKPHSRGSKVYVEELYTGATGQYRSHQIAGIADPSKLPQWAKDKLAEMEANEKPTLHDKLETAKKKAGETPAKNDSIKKRDNREV